MAERHVIITGAGTGLGRAMSLRLLRDGFTCTLAGPDKASLRKTAELAGADGARASVVAGDLRVAETRAMVVDGAAAGPGTLFGLVNNAGVSAAAPLLDESAAQWRTVFEINLEAAYFLAQRAIECMRPYGTGRIVNIGSIYGVVGFDNRGYGSRAPETTPGDRGPVRQSAYDASKGAVIQLTRSLAAAVGRWGITVNAVSPGNVPWANEASDAEDMKAATVEGEPAQAAVRFPRPALGQRVDPEILAALAEQVPLRRLGRAEEIAGAVRFLLSDDAAYVTGHNLVDTPPHHLVRRRVDDHRFAWAA